MKGLVHIARHTAWGVADQALSSLTNFGVGVFVARAVGQTQFGAFALAFAGYVLALSVCRALTTQPFLVRYGGSSSKRWVGATRSATGAATAVGIVGGAGFLLVGWALSGTLGAAFLALGLTLPGLLLQDAWRLVFFARRRGSLAFANDLVWAILLFPSLMLAGTVAPSPVFALTLAWGLSATGAGIVGFFQAGRTAPEPTGGLTWIRDHRDLGLRFLGETVALVGGTQLTLYGIGVVAGLEAVGAIRGGQMLLGPAYVLLVGVQAAFIPEAIRTLERSSRSLQDACRLLAAALTVLILAVGAVLLFLPDRAGGALLGATWEPARRVLIPVTLAMAAGGQSTGAFVGLRALAAVRRSLRARIVTSTITVVGAVTGAATGGVLAAAWGLAGATWIGAWISWVQFRRGLREHAPGLEGRIPPVPRLGDALREPAGQRRKASAASETPS